MRRMYSEQELSKIIKEVFDAEVADGVFDETIADYVDAYLVEHPVDITALEGQTIAPAIVNATTSISAPSIIESMSGYSAELKTKSGYTFEKVYIGACKNGNKLTLSFAINVTKTDADAIGYFDLVDLVIPSAVGNNLYPTLIGGYNFLDVKVLQAFSSNVDYVSCSMYIAKDSSSKIVLAFANANNLVVNTKYYIRYEATFLLDTSL